MTQGLEVEIPTYANDDAGDVIMWSWLGQVPEDGQPLPNMQEELLVDRKVTVPKQLLLDTAEVNGRCYFFYFLKDKPGNISRLSQALPVKVAKRPVPGPITRPSVFLANPKLEYADIAQGIDVTVGPIGDYFRSSDSIVVTWGATDLPPVYLYNGVGFPMDIRVPNDVLRKYVPQCFARPSRTVPFEPLGWPDQVPDRGAITVEWLLVGRGRGWHHRFANR